MATQTMNMVQAINLTLKKELARDNSVILIGEDIGRNGGVFRVTDGLQKEFGEKRVVDTPLAELGIISIAFGMAVAGLKPVAEIQFGGFVYSGMDHIIDHISRIRNRTRGRFTCPMVIRTPYSAGIRALEHHSESMESIFVHTPGLKVVIPSSPYEAKGLLTSAIRDPDPVIFFEPSRVYRAIKEEVPEEDYTIPLGKANVAHEGSDITVISYGAMMKTVLQAFELLKSKYSIEVIDLRTLSPLDEDTIINSVKKTGRCVVVHEAPKTLGMGAEITALINEKAMLNLEAPVERVASFDIPVPFLQMETHYFPDINRVVAGIEKVMNF
ncbi:alpha-ketoacid dehydrogenase subunit beta [Candidatus Woesearchaeota archaeon]|nr:alpha-ketoacid dehydrogenase subunit beta [Candidatus Woesearchaeota archaeon]